MTLPSTLTSIGYRCFEGCSKLKNINLNSGITSIDRRAFYECSKLNCSLPTSLTTVGEQAFNGCTSLTISDLSLPNLQSLGNYAFAGARITKVSDLGTITSIPDGGVIGSMFSIFDSQFVGTITEAVLPATLTYLGRFTFYNHYNLSSVTCLATTPPGIHSGAFDNTNSTFQIYVPAASVSAYQSASGWSSYAARIQAIPT